MRFELPPLEPYALVAYDLNRAIGYNENMLYDPRAQLKTDNDAVWSYLQESDNPVSLIGASETMLEIVPVALEKGIDDILIITQKDRVSPDPKHVRFARTALEAMNMVKPKHTPVAFGGAVGYELLIPHMKWVVATEVRYRFSPANKYFVELPDVQWVEVDRRPMIRGPQDAFDADFVLYKHR